MARLLIFLALEAAIHVLGSQQNIARRTDAFVAYRTAEQRLKTTDPPSAYEFAKRQDPQTILVGPDNTCGFIDGRPGVPWNCGIESARCSILSTRTIGRLACCDDSGQCELKVDCANLADVSSSRCNSGCLKDPFTVKCTNFGTPYCGTVSFPGGILDYFCTSIELSAPLLAYTTFLGQTDREFSISIVEPSTSLSSQTTRASSSSSSETKSQESQTSTSTVQPDSGAATGAIVGGVIGGLALIALIGFGAWFMKKRHGDDHTAPGGPLMRHPSAEYYDLSGDNRKYLSQQLTISPGYMPQDGYFSDHTAMPPISHVTTDSHGTSMQPVSSGLTEQAMSRLATGSPTAVHEMGEPQIQPLLCEAGVENMGDWTQRPNPGGQIHELD